MHILFEGVAAVAVYEIKLGLKRLTETSHISLKKINNILEGFEYGYKNRSSIPAPIPERVFANDDTNLRQSASSMIILTKLLPFFLIEKLACPPDNDVVAFIVEICQICLICLSPVISQETVHLLQGIITTHLKKFKELFPDPHFRWFAYPADRHDARSVEMVRQRFKGALAVEAGSDINPFLLNRVIADETWFPLT